MLTMTQTYNIRKLFFTKGKSISEIHRETKADRKTIRTKIEQDDWNDQITEVKKKFRVNKLTPFHDEIDFWLMEDKKARKKQRHTAMRVFNRLSEKHPDSFNCSYRTVATYVKQKKKEVYGAQEGEIPLVHKPGEAQVDFGTADFYENGTKYEGKYINLSFPFSNRGFIQLYKGENLECLLEGLKIIFERIGGVPGRIWFDNASSMVAAIYKEGSRKLTEGFLRFITHYGFEAVFCNPDSGNEKGNVEGKVGYHRRNMLVPVPNFQKLKDFNLNLFEKCEKDSLRIHYKKEKTIQKLHKKDLEVLQCLPCIPLEVCKYELVRTNGYGKFTLNKGLHEYSASPRVSRSRIKVKITAFEVSPLDESGREIVVHERLYGNRKQESMNWIPYLNTIAKRPGALKYSGIFQLLPESVRKYMSQCTKRECGKILKVLCRLTEKGGFEKASETVERALIFSGRDAESLLSLDNRLNEVSLELNPVSLTENIPQLNKYVPDFNFYDRILEKESNHVN